MQSPGRNPHIISGIIDGMQSRISIILKTETGGYFMNIKKTTEQGTLVLAPEGRLDANTAQQFADELIPAINLGSDVKVDFSKLAYISSTGCRILLMGQKLAATRGVSMTLSSVSEDVMEVLKIMGFTDILTFA